MTSPCGARPKADHRCVVELVFPQVDSAAEEVRLEVVLEVYPRNTKAIGNYSKQSNCHLGAHLPPVTISISNRARRSHHLNNTTGDGNSCGSCCRRNRWLRSCEIRNHHSGSSHRHCGRSL